MSKVSSGRSPLPKPLSERMQQLAALIDSGKSFSAAVDTLAPPPKAVQMALRRVSMVRTFDRELFDAVVKPDPNLAFDGFVRTHGIQAQAPQSDWYRLSDLVAVEHLETWIKEDRAGAIDFSRTVFQHLCERPDMLPIERLRFQIPHDPKGGRDEFERLFKAADETFDLATANALVQLLRDLDVFTVGRRSVPLKFLSDELLQRCNELLPYLTARSRFIEEWAKSNNYQQREALFAKVSAYLDATGSGIFVIYGAGGRGKTMFLQWLVARYCVPLPKRLPVARVDFDDINVAKLEHFPAVLLIRLAEQLNRQMTGAPFSELLDRYVDFLPILSPAPGIPDGVRPDELESQLQKLTNFGLDIVGQFVDTLLDKQVVLLIDTLEEGVLHHGAALRSMLTLLKTVLQQATSARIKLILTGRYDLVLKGFLSPTDGEQMEVCLFGDDEAMPYLTQLRKVPQYLAPTVVAKSAGNPFVLSLIADLIEQKDITAVEQVAELKPDFAYLIQRVIKRIPDSQSTLRWIVRYGVIPRRLTRAFVEKVILDDLRRELESEAFDSLAEYREAFPRGRVLESADQLWSDLKSYADPVGWLRADAQEVRFQPEVVQPMRQLLLKEKIHDKLHGLAADWFEQNAAMQPDQGLRSALYAESFFHRAQRREAGLEEWWRLRSTEMSALGWAPQLALVDAVAALVTADGTLPENVEGGTLLSPQFVSSAYFNLARAGAGIGWGDCRPIRESSEIRDYIDRAERFAPRPVERLLLELAMAVNDREYDDAMHRAVGLERIVTAGARLDDVDRFAMQWLKARAQAGQKSAEARASFEAAITLAVEHASNLRWMLAGEAVRALAEIGAVADAISLANGLVNVAPVVPTSFELDVAEIRVEAGDLGPATSLPGPETVITTTAETLENVARNIRINALRALGSSDIVVADAMVSGIRGDAANLLRPGQMSELEALHAATSYDLSHAGPLFRRALREFTSVGDVLGVARVLLRAVRTARELCGNLSEARSLLTDYAHITSDLLELERAHIALIEGDDAAESNIEPTWREALIGLCKGFEPASLSLHEVFAHIELVEPVGLRLDYLHFFRWVPRLPGMDELESRARELMDSPAPNDPAFFAWSLARFDVLRCLGADSANEVLTGAFHALFSARRADRYFVLERLCEAAMRSSTGKLPAQIEQLRSHCDALYQAGRRNYALAALVRADSALIASGSASIGEVYESDSPPFDRRPFEAQRVDDLLGTEFEYLYYASRYRSAKQRNAEENQFASVAADVLRNLGREPEARRFLAESSAGFPKPGVSSCAQVVVALRAIPNPLEPGDDEARVLAMDPTIVRRLREALPPQFATSPVVEIAADEASTSGLPWEWALKPNQACFRSLAVMPRPMGNPFRRAFWPVLPRRVRRLLGMWKTFRVLILRPPVSYQQKRQRGFEHTSRRSMVDIYRDNGVDIMEASVLTAEAIRKLIVDYTPHCIHVQAPTADRNGQLILDLPLELPSTASLDVLDAELLSRAFRKYPAHGPIVILDPPRPTSDGETARQLLMRNRFAVALALKGRTRAVFCTGLRENEHLQFAAERLAAEMATIPAYLALLSLLRDEIPGDRFSKQGVALYVRDPGKFLA